MALAIALPTASAIRAAEFWDDRNVKVIQTIEMRFPPSLLLDGVTQGRVRAVLEVDASGKLDDFLITAFTHPELGTELARGLPSFEFEPARQRGQSIRCRFEVEFGFEAHGAVISMTPMATVGSHLRGALHDPLMVVLARTTELDQPLAAHHQISPGHPGRALPASDTPGHVTVDFYIDPEGRPRMPVVLRATREEFAMATLDALLQWRFLPPRRQGRPVLVRVVQDFIFPPLSNAPHPAPAAHQPAVSPRGSTAVVRPRKAVHAPR